MKSTEVKLHSMLQLGLIPNPIIAYCLLISPRSKPCTPLSVATKQKQMQTISWKYHEILPEIRTAIFGR